MDLDVLGLDRFNHHTSTNVRLNFQPSQVRNLMSVAHTYDDHLEFHWEVHWWNHMISAGYNSRLCSA